MDLFAPGNPPEDCPLCPRLADFRAENRVQFPSFHNNPVDSYGPVTARLLIVGLAPGLKGANRTGRPFTGDYAGVLLYSTLLEFGFAEGVYDARADDGLELRDCRITNAARCVPPANKPLPQEVANCSRFLTATLAEMAQLQAILALGRIAHDAVLRALGEKPSRHVFLHGGSKELRPGLKLFGCYHCSRYNTNTGRLTAAMFKSVFHEIKACLDGRPGPVDAHAGNFA
jgi:uracil-DNA glycosylase family 4